MTFIFFSGMYWAFLANANVCIDIHLGLFNMEKKRISKKERKKEKSGHVVVVVVVCL